MGKTVFGIATYCGRKKVGALLKSLKLCTEVPYEVVIIDDGSRAGMDCLPYADEAKVVMHGSNQGIVKSWNDIYRNSEGENVIVCNDDVLFYPGWMRAFTYFLDNNPYAGMVGIGNWFMRDEAFMLDLAERQLKAGKEGILERQGLIVPPVHPLGRRPISQDEILSKREYGRPNRVGCPPGYCFAMRRSVWEETGGFPEQIKSMYEDFWMAKACMDAGFVNYQLKWPLLWHILGNTFNVWSNLKGADEIRKSRQQYIQRWGGDTDTTIDPFIEKAPNRVVRWYDDQGEHEEMEQYAE